MKQKRKGKRKEGRRKISDNSMKTTYVLSNKKESSRKQVQKKWREMINWQESKQTVKRTHTQTHTYTQLPIEVEVMAFFLCFGSNLSLSLSLSLRSRSIGYTSKTAIISFTCASSTSHSLLCHVRILQEIQSVLDFPLHHTLFSCGTERDRTCMRESLMQVIN